VFKPVFDYDVCTACGICQTLCPDACINLVDERCIPDYTFCKGCGICAAECSVSAITMVLEEK
jgi:pyruvate ferredoxin oxidoreductase delta subunit